MTYPLWLVNSGALLLFFFSALGLWLTRPIIRPFKSLTIAETSVFPQQEGPAVNIKEIYEKDLFGTFIQPEPIRHSHVTLEEAPHPPAPRPIKIPTPAEPHFIDPLEVTLKGIIYVSGKSDKSRAILQDNATQQEKLYKAGDQVIDGQLIRIFENKILLLRANGQQETLYLREQDSKLDPSFAILTGWEEIIYQVHETEFIIDPIEFVRRVPNLAQFIDQLDLTTVFRKGKALGTRIGSVGPSSLAIALGFMQGDVILSINDIPATDTQERIKIYRSVADAPTNATFSVQFLRNNQLLTHQYQIAEIEDLEDESEDRISPDNNSSAPNETDVAEMIQQLRKKERTQVQAYYSNAHTLPQHT